MKILIILFSSLIIGSGLIAQNSVDHILTKIEKNNTTLSALRKNLDAEKIGNKTGIFL